MEDDLLSQSDEESYMFNTTSRQAGLSTPPTQYQIAPFAPPEPPTAMPVHRAPNHQYPCPAQLRYMNPIASLVNPSESDALQVERSRTLENLSKINPITLKPSTQLMSSTGGPLLASAVTTAGSSLVDDLLSDEEWDLLSDGSALDDDLLQETNLRTEGHALHAEGEVTEPLVTDGSDTRGYSKRMREEEDMMSDGAIDNYIATPVYTRDASQIPVCAKHDELNFYTRDASQRSDLTASRLDVESDFMSGGSLSMRSAFDCADPDLTPAPAVETSDRFGHSNPIDLRRPQHPSSEVKDLRRPQHPSSEVKDLRPFSGVHFMNDHAPQDRDPAKRYRRDEPDSQVHHRNDPYSEQPSYEVKRNDLEVSMPPMGRYAKRFGTKTAAAVMNATTQAMGQDIASTQMYHPNSFNQHPFPVTAARRSRNDADRKIVVSNAVSGHEGPRLMLSSERTDEPPAVFLENNNEKLTQDRIFEVTRQDSFPVTETQLQPVEQADTHDPSWQGIMSDRQDGTSVVKATLECEDDQDGMSSLEEFFDRNTVRGGAEISSPPTPPRQYPERQNMAAASSVATVKETTESNTGQFSFFPPNKMSATTVPKSKQRPNKPRPKVSRSSIGSMESIITDNNVSISPTASAVILKRQDPAGFIRSSPPPLPMDLGGPGFEPNTPRLSVLSMIAHEPAEVSEMEVIEPGDAHASEGVISLHSNDDSSSESVQAGDLVVLDSESSADIIEDQNAIILHGREEDDIDKLVFAGIHYGGRDVAVNRTEIVIQSPAMNSCRYPRRKRVKTMRWWCSEKANYGVKKGDSIASLISVSEVELKGHGFWSLSETIRKSVNNTKSIMNGPTKKSKALAAPPSSPPSTLAITASKASSSHDPVDMVLKSGRKSFSFPMKRSSFDVDWIAYGSYFISSVFHIGASKRVIELNSDSIGISTTRVKIPPGVTIRDNNNDNNYCVTVDQGNLMIVLPRSRNYETGEQYKIEVTAGRIFVIKPHTQHEFHNLSLTDDAIIRLTISGTTA
eukprot:GHVH01003415.1.p1 GENE.GHVH01003415.1~~GHVH01003415.1.p1  ORF type:complete len:1016 (+),score=170.37 GHVH01003415.1:147-3194(+)